MSKQKKTEEIKEHWLNQMQAAKSAGVSVQAFTKWEVRPVKRIGRQAFYEVKDILKNRLDHQAQTIKKSMDSTEAEGIDRERERLVRAQADSQEMKNEIMEGRYIPTDFGREVLAKVLVQVSGILNALPLTIKRKHPKLEQRIIDSLSEEIVKHSNEAARLDEFIDQAIDEVIRDSEGKV